MKAQKARTVKAWAAVRQTFMMWTISHMKKQVREKMDNNGWRRDDYRIARVEIREIK